MKTISLTKGFSALVDDEDYDRLSIFHWHAVTGKNHSKIYAGRRIRKKGGTYISLMHREVMNLERSDPREVDHRDNCATTDNRKHNLRLSTHRENSYNSRTRKHNRSGLKGAHFDPRHCNFTSKITVAGKTIYLGTFSTAHGAHAAYCEAALRLHGEFARIQ